MSISERALKLLEFTPSSKKQRVEFIDDGFLRFHVESKNVTTVDSLILFSQDNEKFFDELISLEKERVKLTQLVVNAFNQTSETKFKEFLLRLCSTENCLPLLLELKDLPIKFFEYTFENCLNKDRTLEDEKLLQIMVELIGIERVIDIILSMLFKQQNIGNLTMKKFLSSMKKQSAFFDISRNKVLQCLQNEEEDLSGSSSIRACQYVFEEDGNTYSTFIGQIFEGRSATEFRKLINLLTLLLPSDPIWVLTIHRQIVHSSPMKHLKCRAIYSNQIRDILNLDHSSDKKEEFKAIMEAFKLRPFDIPDKVKTYLVKEPVLFEKVILPMLQHSKSYQVECTHLLSLIEKVFPIVKNKISEPPLKAFEDPTSSEIVSRIIDQFSKLDSEQEPVGIIEEITKNIRTFCALACCPNIQLLNASLLLFRSKALGEKYSILRKLLLNSEPFIGSHLLDEIVTEVLFKNLHEKNENLCMQLELAGYVDKFFIQLVSKSCSLNHGLCLKTISIYAQFSRKFLLEHSSQEVNWLRLRLDRIITPPCIEFDEYDSYVGETNLYFFSNFKDFLKFEMLCQDDSLQRLIFFHDCLVENQYKENQVLIDFFETVFDPRVYNPNIVSLCFAIFKFVTNSLSLDECFEIFLQCLINVIKNNKQEDINKTMLNGLEMGISFFPITFLPKKAPIQLYSMLQEPVSASIQVLWSKVFC